MDLSQLKPQVTKLELVHPSFGQTGIQLSLISQDNKAFQTKKHVITKAMIGKQAKDIDVGQAVKDNNELIALCIVGWEGLTDKGEELVYSPQAALDLISDVENCWIKEQVEEFIADRKNFFRKPGEAA